MLGPRLPLAPLDVLCVARLCGSGFKVQNCALIISKHVRSREVVKCSVRGFELFSVQQELTLQHHLLRISTRTVSGFLNQDEGETKIANH